MVDNDGEEEDNANVEDVLLLMWLVMAEEDDGVGIVEKPLRSINSNSAIRF